ncbi:hypothetical protein K7711_43445 [Nocardia sp. CA2R105]|uniref:YciI family protein n=1 Tax=Nocardia coffeae TaxID=2873381 RepID=UPI001CA73BD4|nr:hypothetical protein [Nocardia coffeae]MBY8863386.1 hypothetical protein [Nocardia coffeae]
MKFFVDGRFVPGKAAEPHMLEERKRVKELKESGALLWAYRRPEIGGGAILLIESDTREGADELLESLPFVRLGIMSCDVEEVESLDFIWATAGN